MESSDFEMLASNAKSFETLSVYTGQGRSHHLWVRFSHGQQVPPTPWVSLPQDGEVLEVCPKASRFNYLILTSVLAGRSAVIP